jgi:hydroxymethylglutaryl-CoA reductase (NADPH)
MGGIIVSKDSEDLYIFRRKGAENFDPQVVSKRKEWLENQLDTRLDNISKHCFDTNKLMGYIENPIGAVQVPLAVAGPLTIKGDHAQGEFYVPFATTEGALVASYQRGMNAITEAGGANVKVLRNETHISPLFISQSQNESIEIASFVKDNFEAIKKAAESTTQHGKLLKIESIITGRQIYLRFIYSTGDAMGLNMINIATHSGCEIIRTKFPKSRYFLRSNYSSDKKACHANFINPYGREVLVECRVPQEILSKSLNTNAQDVYEYWINGLAASAHAGMLAVNAQVANGLTAIFIACGQDVAQVVNSSAVMLTCGLNDDGSLYMALRIPSLLVGTVGGGTALPTQKEGLSMLDCYGPDKADKFAEIVAASVLAGELSISAALTTTEFVEAHGLIQQLTKRNI